MRAYSQHDEESLRDQGLLRGWIASGFLTADQNSALQAELNVPLRRTHGVLRAVLFLFTALIVAAAVGLLGDLFDAHSFATSLVLFASSALISLVLAWLLATRTRLYRCGVEEALAAAGVVLLMLALGWEGWKFQHVLSTATGALASFGVYRVFRFRYAVVASVFFAGMIPFALPFAAQTQPVIVRTSSLLIFAITFFIGGAIHRRHRGEILEDDCTAIKVTAFGGMYFVLNLVISSRWFGFAAVSSGWFYWFSYALTLCRQRQGQGREPGFMSEKASQLRIGIFVVVGLAILLAALFLFGIRTAFEPTYTLETYVPDNVDGLSVGSVVKLRGVAVGKVTEIGFSWNMYEVIEPAVVVVRFEIRQHISPEMFRKDFDEALKTVVGRGVRAVIQPQGITGTSIVALQTLDPKAYPPLTFPWKPKHPWTSPWPPASSARSWPASTRLSRTSRSSTSPGSSRAALQEYSRPQQTRSTDSAIST